MSKPTVLSRNFSETHIGIVLIIELFDCEYTPSQLMTNLETRLRNGKKLSFIVLCVSISLILFCLGLA